MSRTTWRQQLAPIISRVIEQLGTEDLKTLRKALREACPLGELRFWPYKVWCTEIRRQLAGVKPPKDNAPMPLFEHAERQ